MLGTVKYPRDLTINTSPQLDLSLQDSICQESLLLYSPTTSSRLPKVVSSGTNSVISQGPGSTAATTTLRKDRISMSFPASGAGTSFAGAWTPDRDSVISGFTTDAGSIYASLQRPTNLLYPVSSQQQQQQHYIQTNNLHHQQQQQQQQLIQSPHYSSPVLPQGHPRTKNSLGSSRRANKQ